MITVRCKVCNVELHGNNKLQCCGCSNMTTVRGDKVSAVDLSKVVLINSETSVNNQDVLTNQDLQYQEDRRKRKIRKLNFEVR